MKDLIKDNLKGLDLKELNTHDIWWATAQNWHHDCTLRTGNDDGSRKTTGEGNRARGSRYSHLDDVPMGVRMQRQHDNEQRMTDGEDDRIQAALTDRVTWQGKVFGMEKQKCLDYPTMDSRSAYCTSRRFQETTTWWGCRSTCSTRHGMPPNA